MVIGVIIGEFVPGVQQAFDTVKFYSVSVRKLIYSTDRKPYS
jgi:ACR3 family arsenite efflux pump ArsB